MPTSDLTSSAQILVVDDQAANLRTVGAFLARNGYDVLTAESGEEALAMALANPPDLILLDMLMPGMDGFEVLAEIKNRSSLLRVPVIFLTVANDQDLLLRAFDSGAVDYVTKPFMPEELLARVNAHVGLKTTRDRLEKVASERQQLINLVAHDLKNPLTSVLFASEILLQGDIAEKRVPRYLEMIHESSQDALRYIRHYLERQSRLKKSSEKQHVATSSLHDLATWLEKRYALQLEGRGQQLIITNPPTDDVAIVSIESLVLRQVVENLITNAMKYAEQSDIEVEFQKDDANWQIRVSDRGPGVEKSRQQDLFKPFSMLSDDTKSRHVSSGLGLSLARQIVEHAEGRLTYQDRHGGGATFTVEIPRSF